MSSNNAKSRYNEHLKSDNDILLNCAFGIVLIAAAFILAKVLFGDEFGLVIDWWFTVLVMGIVFMPLSDLIFAKFSDNGWMFSKVIGIAVSGWLVWYLSSLHILKFTRTGCFIVLGICLVANVLIVYLVRRKSRLSGKKIGGLSDKMPQLSHALIVEGIFLTLFVFWLYLKGFNPKAYGTTEKLMDFGFMQSMFKSEYMPPEDLWLAGEKLNYYYVGQFMATYITKVCGCGVEYGYNFMLMMIAAMGFSLPASIVYNVAKDFNSESDNILNHPAHRIFPALAAGLSGIAVSFAGNLHYVIFAKIVPWLRTILGLDKLAESAGYSFPGYWFPNATRYIGYNPETEDKTIHEFPLYSFVLGDLHAHVINIIFVLTVAAVLYSFLQYRKKRMDASRLLGIVDDEDKNKMFGIPNFLKEVFHPCIILTGFFIGLFHTTNFWDFPIYFVVAGAVILFSNCCIYNYSWNTLKLTAFHAAVVLIVAKLTCLPFTLNFKQIATSVRLCENRTPLYQLAILWGLPITVVFVFLGILIRNQKDEHLHGQDSVSRIGKENGLYRFIGNLQISDLFILTLGLCAVGLILIPEVIYVKDIYSGSYKRANTMFKLTYQSYIMFGMVMGYVIAKLLIFAKKKKRRTFAIVACVILLWTVGYFGNSTKAWFGDWKNPVGFIGLDSGEYLESVNEEDYDACNWINSNIDGRPVMLEVNGDSYTDYCRVSVRTGLPTVLGWRTHEWLWQSDGSADMPEIVSKRSEDIETIYTSKDSSTVTKLLKQYNVEYIYIGSLEREKYESPVNHRLLQSLGKVIYPLNFDSSEAETTTYIIQLY